jgi:hypothetical protein
MKENLIIPTWKENWLETRQHFIDWWEHKGMVLAPSGGIISNPAASRAHEDFPHYDRSSNLVRYYTDPVFRANCEHDSLAHYYLGGDIIPIAGTDIGPGTLALYMGSEPELTPETVWYYPSMEGIDQKLKFNPESKWWQITQATLAKCMEMAQGRYLVGCPDLIENLDILASLREAKTMYIDLIEHPGEALERIHEINQAWFEAYDRIYDIIHLEDGSSCFGAFSLWGPGKTAKLQCDASALISPKMFRRFVAPFLKEQCQWLDHSMYHLDGHQCICHLDALLEIEELDAIEWTADLVVPSGGDPVWYPLIHRILDGGKSVQIVNVETRHIRPLLDQFGPKGLYLFPMTADQKEYEELYKLRDEYSG